MKLDFLEYCLSLLGAVLMGWQAHVLFSSDPRKDVERLILLLLHQEIPASSDLGVTSNELQRLIGCCRGRMISIGLFYVILEEMEERGLLTKRHLGDPVPERGNRQRVYINLTHNGHVEASRLLGRKIHELA